tara:strand:+ start:2132 stop:10012 length:7881 start_codon:yes stop_codon:yes gene_type:complete
MPEIKHQFTGGKMNKDLDERLVPNGEYRDAMNIQVSTSEGSGVGTVQNVLGNLEVLIGFQLLDTTCVGSIADEKSDSSYWFIRGSDASSPIPGAIEAGVYSRDYIIRNRSEGVDIIFTDTKLIISKTLTGVSIDIANNIIEVDAAWADVISVGDVLTDIMTVDSQGLGISHPQQTVVTSIIAPVSVGGSYKIAVNNIESSVYAASGLIIGTLPLTGPHFLYFKSNCLDFQLDSNITGINIIDNLLFWTDNNGEPKMLNIDRSREGTHQDGLLHTRLVNPQLPLLQNFKKVEPHHIQVIKRKPTHALRTVQSEARRAGLTIGQNISFQFSDATAITFEAGYEGSFTVDSTVPGVNVNYDQNDIILLLNSVDQNDVTSGRNLPEQFDVKVLIQSITHDVTTGITEIDFQIISIDINTPFVLTDYTSIIYEPNSTLFDKEMFRFSYRYNFLDGQVSAYAPFTPTVFASGEFKYDQLNAYNYGMVNNVTDLTLSNFVDFQNTLDVVSIDLLVKNDGDPSVYLIDTVRREDYPSTSYDSSGSPSGGSYKFNPKQVHATIPSNQLLRPYDNVPRKALAQELTGNRIVYGNYLEAYNYPSNNTDLKPGVANRPTRLVQPKDGYPSIKTQRNYQVGMVLVDKEGRESPIITNENANVDVPKSLLDNNTMLTVSNNSILPGWVNSYKYYVKDSSKPSYNLVIDSFYKSESGDYWVSVPSSERNKVKEGDLIELKKGINDNRALLQPLRTKVIAIENEAPDFIKLVYRKLGKAQVEWVDINSNSNELFTSDGRPSIGQDWFKIDKEQWMKENVTTYGGGADLKDLDLAFSFDAVGLVSSVIGGFFKSKLYMGECTVNLDDSSAPPSATNLAVYHIRLDENIRPTDDFMFDTSSTSGLNPALNLTVYKKTFTASSEYHGKFFMKLEAKTDLVESIAPTDIINVTESQQAKVEIRNFVDHAVSPGGQTTNKSISGQTMSTTTYNSGAVAGRMDTYDKWKSLLEYDLNTAADFIPQYWFVDRMWKARDQNQYDLTSPTYQGGSNGGGYGLGVFNCTVDQATSSLPNATPSYNRENDSTSPDYGLNRGWLQAGQWYMEMSIAGMMKKIPMDTTYNTYNIGVANATPQGEDSAWDIRFQRKGIGYTQAFSAPWTYDNDIPDPTNQSAILSSFITPGQKFKYEGGVTIFTILDYTFEWRWNHTTIETAESNATSDQEAFVDPSNRRLCIILQIDQDPTSDIAIDPTNINQVNAFDTAKIIFLTQDINVGPGEAVLSSNNPAVFEVPKEDEESLDIYYEASDEIPITLSYEDLIRLIPIGSTVAFPAGPTLLSNSVVTNITIPDLGQQSRIQINNAAGGNASYIQWQAAITNGDKLQFNTPSGNVIGISIQAVQGGTSSTPLITPVNNTLNDNVNYGLSWSNCISFRNGVESVYLKDDFNEIFLSKGVKASSTLEKEYQEKRKSSGLIYSGLFNSTSDLNNLNQFIAAEQITKDLNPTYGSIQKLHTRDTDLVTLCEDKVLKVLANKDAVFNADGNPQLTANNNVLGQTIPFTGEFGISKNPESFASESFRVYFTDKTRGAVMRLSKDGLTPISDHGMKDWFRDNLKLNDTLLGSYDDKKDEYNITLKQTTENTGKSVSFREDVRGWVSFKSFVPQNGISCANEYYTFNTDALWKHNVEKFNSQGNEVGRNTFYNNHVNSTLNVILNDVPSSVKSFNTINYEGSQSKIETNYLDKEYYNLHQKKGWHVDSIFTNKESGTVNEFIEKEGKWFNYIKGKQVQLSGQYLLPGSSTFDQASFAIQGLGVLSSNPINVTIAGCNEVNAFNYNPDATVNDGSCIPVVYGCLLAGASNWAISANTDTGDSCVWLGCVCNPSIYPNGCTNPSPFSAEAFLYNGGNSIFEDGSCIAIVNGCTDVTAANYDALANVDDGSCASVVTGCTVALSDNYNPLANTDDGTCTWVGCTNVLATNYGWYGWGTGGGGGTGFPGSASTYAQASPAFGIQDDGNCQGAGCTNPLAQNYDAAATYDDGSCLVCNWGNNQPYANMIRGVSASGLSDGQIALITGPPAPYLPYIYTLVAANGTVYDLPFIGQGIDGIGDPDAVLFNGLPEGDYIPLVLGVNGCIYQGVPLNIGILPPVIYYGCTDATSCNFEFYADATHVDNNSCEFVTCAGCMDPTASVQSPAGYGNAVTGAFNTQGSGTATSTSPCLDFSNPGPCLIDCAGVFGGNDYGCCAYTIYGCMDATAVNYNSSANVSDGSCYFSGCMDFTFGSFSDTEGNDQSGNPCQYPCQDANGIDLGYNANNFNPNATVSDPQACTYTSQGCMDTGYLNIANGDPYNSPNPGVQACNYDINAQADNGTCVYGFNGATIGDPNAFDQFGGVTTPIFYTPTGLNQPVPTIQHNTSTYPVAPNYLPIGFDDVGLTIFSQSSSMAQYSGSGQINLTLYKQVGNTYTSVHTQSIPTTAQFWLNQAGGAVYGLRNASSQPPYPFGPGQTSPLNYVFDVYVNPNAVPLVKVQYALEITSTINGNEYGKPLIFNGATPTCGVFQAFEINTQSVCQHPDSITGCTDPSACNYDPLANCEDFGSCYYGGIPNPNAVFYYSANQSPSCFQASPCQMGGFGAPLPPPPTFATLAICQQANPGPSV